MFDRRFENCWLDVKNRLVEYVRDQLKYEVEDCGASVNDPQDDYPGIIAVAARKLSEDIAAGKNSRAIVAGASGQGEAIMVNKFKGSLRPLLWFSGDRAIRRFRKNSGYPQLNPRT
jgi:ribose 5-phosphate isomerase B